jgi:hypothetical protein
MKILMLIDSFTVGGAQRQLTSLAIELNKEKENNITIVVYHSITSHFENDLIKNGIRIKKILKKSRFDVLFIIKLLYYIKNEKFDVSISFLDTPNFYNILAKFFGCVKKVIVSQRSAYFKENISLKKRIQESLLYFADYITTNSITQKERMEILFPFFKKKIHYLPNVYEIPNEVISRDNNKMNFLVLSNTRLSKNPYKLCEAIIEYKKRIGIPKFKISWYGRIVEDKEDYNRLKLGIDLLINNNLEHIIEFKGITDVPLVKITESDLLIHISDYEGCPNSVCEAMLYKTPVFLSNVCDAFYLLNNNRGILVDNISAIEIANKIYEFENLNSEKINDMTNKAQYFIKQNFNINSSLSILYNLINK